MRIKNLEYHKKELHKISEKIKQLKKSLDMSKRKRGEDILDKLLKSYKYWIRQTKTQANTNRVGYIKNKIKDFYKLNIAKIFHQSAIVALTGTKKRRNRPRNKE